ncbi:hypothetical protein [Streptomyces sp. RerS4]|uniref:hypothetical protein n=1 Tax=Streptomyces sp. RerS4 TaxID=2942449 RepID=UPI00201BA45F|nr:hypothetical protein [Streptomyces sp. RerS4]UQX01279.1 hypothetical protein M4D82_12640 [Streptomyces sp. RerS4]
MRVMLRAHMDTTATNEGIRSGSLPETVKKMLESLKPEAAYFGLHEGVRSMWVVFDLDDSSKLPVLLEPLFLQYNAEIEVGPVMNADDLGRGLAAMKSSP